MLSILLKCVTTCVTHMFKCNYSCNSVLLSYFYPTFNVFYSNAPSSNYNSVVANGVRSLGCGCLKMPANVKMITEISKTTRNKINKNFFIFLLVFNPVQNALEVIEIFLSENIIENIALNVSRLYLIADIKNSWITSRALFAFLSTNAPIPKTFISAYVGLSSALSGNSVLIVT